jgi:YidC/Oxa1 family membrane protein insertase
MDRRTLIGLLVAMMAIQIYFTWVTPKAVPTDATDPTATAATTSGEPSSATATAAPAVDPASPELPLVTLDREICTARAQLTTDGGALRGVQLTDFHADYLVDPWWQWVYRRATGGTSDGWHPYTEPKPAPPAPLATNEAQILVMGAGDLDAAAPRVAITEQTPDRVVLVGTTAEGIEITRTITTGADCLLDVTATWRNTGPTAWSGPVWVGAFDHLPETYGRYVNTGRPYAMVDGSVTRWAGKLTDIDGHKPYPGDVSWFGIHDRYFTTVILPDHDGPASIVFMPRKVGDVTLYGEDYASDATLAPGATVSHHFRVYMGPMRLSVLKAIAPDLAKAVDLGWFGFFSGILFYFLSVIHGVIGDWALSIIALTFALKALFFPLTNMSFRSGQAMQALQPKLAQLREELADNQEELSRRTMELFRENGVNPVGGCLPMLAQTPVWIALYSMLNSSVDLYQTRFLYIHDLASPDPYGFLPLIVVGLMVLQQQLMPMGNMDPAQARMMKLMPLMFGLFFFQSPAGLVVYFFVNNVLTMLQQWVIKRTYAPPQ